MTELRAHRYRRKAEECRYAAEEATNGVDRNDWLSPLNGRGWRTNSRSDASEKLAEAYEGLADNEERMANLPVIPRRS
jgi:hypothetical protein